MATGSDASESGFSAFLRTLNNYKEVIAILVFFIGGVFWAFAYFATREQLDATKCLMNANIDFMQGRMDSSNLSQIMQKNIEESISLEGHSQLSAADAAKKSQLKITGDEIGQKIVAADALTTSALERLKSGVCAAK